MTVTAKTPTAKQLDATIARLREKEQAQAIALKATRDQLKQAKERRKAMGPAPRKNGHTIKPSAN